MTVPLKVSNPFVGRSLRVNKEVFVYVQRKKECSRNLCKWCSLWSASSVSLKLAFLNFEVCKFEWEVTVGALVSTVTTSTITAMDTMVPIMATVPDTEVATVRIMETTSEAIMVQAIRTDMATVGHPTESILATAMAMASPTEAIPHSHTATALHDIMARRLDG